MFKTTKTVKFSEVPMGEPFFLNGTEYIKINYSVNMSAGLAVEPVTADTLAVCINEPVEVETWVS